MKQNFILALLILIFYAGGLSAQEAMDTTPAKPSSQVTLMNWSEQPFNKWSFRNVGMQPSVMVPRSGKIVSLPRKLDESIAKTEFEYQGKTHTVQSAMIDDDTDGYIVLKDGMIVCEEYFGKFGEHNHHLWASCTKSLVGLSMGILVSERKVKVEDRAETYLPELKGKHFGQRTVREILNMVSALDYSEDYETFEPGAVSTAHGTLNS